MRLFLLSLLALFPALADDGFTVGGTVVDHAQRPLKKILVTLLAPNGKSVAVITGPDGRFRFLHVPKGKYVLQANSRNGRTQQYRQHDEYSTGIVAGPGQDSEHLVFAFTTGAVIAGTVLDDSNEPLANSQILVFRKAVVHGRFDVAPFGSTNTGPNGVFFIGDLPPGIYFVAAQAHPWFAQNEPGSPNELDVVYPLTYYGGSTDPNSAKPLVLYEGGSMDLAFILHTVPALQLTMPDIPPDATSGVNVQLSLIGPGGISVPVGVSMSSTQEGTGRRHVAVNGLAPGEYRIQTASSNAPPSYGRLSLYSSANFSSLEIKPSPTVDGQLNFHGAKALAQTLFLRFSCGSFLPVAADGKFTSKGQALKPGPCTVEVVNLPNAALESLTANGVTSGDDSFAVPPAGHVHLTLEVSQSQAPVSVEGVVLSGGKPLAGAMVLLVPEDQTRNLRFRRDQSDSDGTFVLRDIRPGKYILLAIEDRSDVPYLEPGELNPYLPAGMPLEFPLKNAQELKIAVQTRRRAN